MRLSMWQRRSRRPLAYYAFPEEHRRGIRTHNPLERILREIRRRTRVVGAFPDGNRRSISLQPGCNTSPAPACRHCAVAAPLKEWVVGEVEAQRLSLQPKCIEQHR